MLVAKTLVRPTVSLCGALSIAALLAAVPAAGQAPAPATPTLTPQQAAQQMEKHLLSYANAEARKVLQQVSGASTAALAVANGRLLMQEKKYPEATAELKRAATMAPTDPGPHLFLGETYLYVKDAAQATAAFQKAAELARARLVATPDNAEALYSLGVAQQRLRQLPEAVATLTKARDQRPGHALTLYQLGVTRALQQLWSESFDQLSKTIEVEPGIAYAYYYRGLAASRVGRKDVMVNDMSRFLALAPSAPEAPAAQKVLDAAR